MTTLTNGMAPATLFFDERTAHWLEAYRGNHATAETRIRSVDIVVGGLSLPGYRLHPGGNG